MTASHRNIETAQKDLQGGKPSREIAQEGTTRRPNCAVEISGTRHERHDAAATPDAVT